MTTSSVVNVKEQAPLISSSCTSEQSHQMAVIFGAIGYTAQSPLWSWPEAAAVILDCWTVREGATIVPVVQM